MKNKLAFLGGKPVRNKPFQVWPQASNNERMYLKQVINSNGWGIFRGSKIREFEKEFASYHGATYGIACVNATVALEVQLRALGIGHGDEVITSIFSCTATATSIIRVGAVPIFVDILSENYCLQPTEVIKKITPKTKAIIAVHLYGSLCDLDSLAYIAKTYDLYLIEDAAQVPGAFWRGQGVGTIGISGSFSFQESKAMTAGEGGIIITNNRDLSEIMHAYVNCGRTQPNDIIKRKVLGNNYRMTEFQAAILLGQLQLLQKRTFLREKNARYLNNALRNMHGIQVVNISPLVNVQAYYLYVFAFIEKETQCSRDLFIRVLNAEGIPTRNTFVPLYRDPLFNINKFDAPQFWKHAKRHPLSPSDFPMAEKASKEIVALWHPLLLGTQSDVNDIIEAIKKIFDHMGELRTYAK